MRRKAFTRNMLLVAIRTAGTGDASRAAVPMFVFENMMRRLQWGRME